MTPLEQHRRDDDATCFLMALTSWLDPRDQLVDCGACGRPFWRHATTGTPARYCSESCKVATYYHRRVAAGDRKVGRAWVRAGGESAVPA